MEVLKILCKNLREYQRTTDDDGALSANTLANMISAAINKAKQEEMQDVITADNEQIKKHKDR